MALCCMYSIILSGSGHASYVRKISCFTFHVSFCPFSHSPIFVHPFSFSHQKFHMHLDSQSFRTCPHSFIHTLTTPPSSLSSLSSPPSTLTTPSLHPPSPCSPLMCSAKRFRVSCAPQPSCATAHSRWHHTRISRYSPFILVRWHHARISR